MILYILAFAANTDDTAMFCVGTFSFVMLTLCGLIFWHLTAPYLRERKNAREALEKAKARAEQDEIQAKKDLEAFDNLYVKYEQLSESQDYTLIAQFTKKYRSKDKELLYREPNEQLSNLKDLLEVRGWKFSVNDLFHILSWEKRNQYRDLVYKKILTGNPETKREIIESYLDKYQTDDLEALDVLKAILENKGLLKNLSAFKADVEKIKKEIELKSFEKRLLEEDEQIRLSEIDTLDGYEFEDFLKTLFSKMGYRVEKTKLSGDQGADLVVIKFGERSVIQAKCYAGKVGNSAIQEIMAAISLYKAQKGMVVTNSYFTIAAIELADANNIELIDRNGLEELINKHW